MCSDRTGDKSSDVARFAYFFVPLPEAIVLPDRQIVPFHREITTDDLLAMSTTERESLTAPLLETSLQFHQRTGARDAHNGILASVFQVALEAVPGATSRASDAPNREHLPVPLTVVEMVVALDNYDDIDGLDALSGAFDRGLDAIRTVQRAYHLATKREVTLIAREALPFLVPLAVRGVGSDPVGGWPEGLSLFVVNNNLTLAPPPLSEDQTEALRMALEYAPAGRPFLAFADLARESRQALTRRGDLRSAVVLAATAAEILLDDLLLMLLWEDCVPPREAARYFGPRNSVRQRVQRDYAERIGGRWNLSQVGAVRAWFEDLASLRNGVVHTGIEPSLDETALAVKALESLAAFIDSRLATPRVLARYPRTSLLLLGKPELSERRLWTQRLQRITDDKSEVEWIPTFARWRKVLDLVHDPTNPDPTRAVLVAVAWPDSTVHWWLHDRAAGLIRAVGQPSLDQLPAIAEVLQEPREAPRSIALPGVQLDLGSNSAWIDAYRALPLFGVMRDGSDLNEAGLLWAARVERL